MTPQRRPDDLYMAVTDLKSVLWYAAVVPWAEPVVKWLARVLARVSR